MKSRWSSSTSMACRRALSIMNSVRVLPRIAAASSMSWRVCVSIRRLMLPLVWAAEERSATAAPKLSEDEEWPFDIRGNYVPPYLQRQYESRPSETSILEVALLAPPEPWSNL